MNDIHLKISYNNNNSSELSNSLTNVEAELKQSHWSYLCVENENNNNNIIIIGFWEMVGQVFRGLFGGENMTSKKNLDSAFKEILDHNKEFIDNEQLNKIKSIAQFVGLTDSLENKKNREKKLNIKGITEVTKFLSEVQEELNQKKTLNSFTATPFQANTVQASIPEEEPKKETQTPEVTAETQQLEKSSEKAIPKEDLQAFELSQKLSKKSPSAFPEDHPSKSPHDDLKETQEEIKGKRVAESEEEILLETFKFDQSDDSKLEGKKENTSDLHEKTPVEPENIVQKEDQAALEPDHPINEPLIETEPALKVDLDPYGSTKIKLEENNQGSSSLTKLLWGGIAVGVSLFVARYFAFPHQTTSLPLSNRDTNDWYQNFQREHEITHIFTLIDSSSVAREIIDLIDFSRVFLPSQDASANILEEKPDSAPSLASQVDFAISLGKEVDEGLSLLNLNPSLINGKLSLFSSMPDMKNKLSEYPERIEDAITSAISDKRASLASYQVNSENTQNIVLLDVAKQLFAMNRGHKLINKILDLYFSPDITPKDVIVFQQIIEAASESQTFEKDIHFQIRDKLKDMKRQMQQYNFMSVDNYRGVNYLSLKRIARKSETLMDNYFDPQFSEFPNREVHDLVWAYKSATDKSEFQEIENKLLNLKDFSTLDRAISELIFNSNQNDVPFDFREPIILHDGIEKLTNHLLEDNSGHNFLKAILKQHIIYPQRDDLLKLINTAIEKSPQTISELFFKSDGLDFSEKVLLRTIVSNAIFEKRINGDRILTLLHSNFINDKSSHDNDYYDNLLNVQKLIAEIPNSETKTTLLNALDDSLKQAHPARRSFFNYKSVTNPDMLRNSYNEIAQIIDSGQNLEQIDLLLSKVISSNHENEIPNFQQIFKEESEYRIHNLISKLIEKGSGSNTIVALTKLLFDPNYSGLTLSGPDPSELMLKNAQLIEKAIEYGDQSTIQNIDITLAEIIADKTLTFTYINTDKSVVELQNNGLFFKKLPLEGIFRSLFKNHDKLKQFREVPGYTLDLVFHRYRNCNNHFLIHMENSLNLDIIKYAIDQLPEEKKEVIQDELISPYGVMAKTYPNLSEFYKMLGKGNNEKILELAMQRQPLSPNAKLEFDEIILSSENTF
jgi:hypothetical protein